MIAWRLLGKLDDSIHALYNTHLLRELVYVKEITGKQWPESMMQLVLCANRLCTAARRQQRTLDPNDMAAFSTDYDAQVREGEAIHPETAQQLGQRVRRKQSVAANLLRRFRLHADAILFFISNPAVPFTNNVGERVVLMSKVKKSQNVSARSPALNISAPFAPATTRCSSKGTACSPSCNVPSLAVLSSQPHSRCTVTIHFQ
ncbi:transposase [Janthinobacterium sp. J1-1]|uniref:IS66 family transposase n=1 Tax=Janthinobacterium sp. J1-1 TaxID=3065910 RepID=UPI0028119D23|nr:transposase [Janthinobacterium sp. J1-1]